MSVQILTSEISDASTNRVIERLRNNTLFDKLSEIEGGKLVKRDKYDQIFLEEGIQIAIEKGLLPRKQEFPKSFSVVVDHKSSVKVANEIQSQLDLAKDPRGELVIIQGLSGVGKGTTAKRLVEKLPDSVTWSSGNGFRAITLLANLFAQKQELPLEQTIQSKEFIDGVFKAIGVEYSSKGYDIYLDEFGVKSYVGDIINTRLQNKEITENVPLVAKYTQGEMIKFAGESIETLRDNNLNVVIEGRRETMQYFASLNRFELCIKNHKELGKRRAAQRILAEAKRLIAHGYSQTAEQDILNESLGRIARKEKII